MALDKFDVFNNAKIHDDNEDRWDAKNLDINDYEDKIYKSFKKIKVAKDDRVKSLDQFHIGKTYTVLSLKSVPIIEQEIKILDKDYRRERLLITFKRLGNKDSVTMWVNPTNFQIVDEVNPEVKKHHVKWYSKGKLSKEEDWVNESKENRINLSYKLTDFVNFNISKLTDSQIINSILNIFMEHTGKRVEVLAKKSVNLFGNYKDEKIYNFEILSYLTEIEGRIIFLGKENNDVENHVNYYKVDLVRCAENPEEYPIYVRDSKRLHTPEDPFGEEDWAID